MKHCDKVKTFYINGGEPTLIKQHFAFLEKLVELGKTDIKLWYNINMTNMNDKVIDLWRKFDNVKVSCSIDDLGDRNYYIRYPSDWDTVIKNFKRLKEENFELDVTQTVSWMNYSTLGISIISLTEKWEYMYIIIMFMILIFFHQQYYQKK